MVYCFVYAPTKDNWAGEMVLGLQKRSGEYLLKNVETIIRELYPDHMPEEFHYSTDPSQAEIDKYLDRKRNGKMQRLSRYGTHEEMEHSEWEKTIKKKYPDIFYIYNPKI